MDAEAPQEKSTSSGKVATKPWKNKGEDTLYLIRWITTEGNYTRYQGKSNKGKRKIQLCDAMARSMEDLCGYKRTGKDVYNKINHLVDSFKKAHDIIKGTGSGNQGNETLDEQVRKKCYFYHELLPILGSRSAVVPVCTNETPNYLDSMVTQKPSATTSLKMAPPDTTSIDTPGISHGNNESVTIDLVGSRSITPIQKLPEASAEQPKGASKKGTFNGFALDRSKKMEMEVAEIRRIGEEEENSRKRKLELEIEITEMEKSTKMKDDELREAQRYLELYKTYKELEKIHTDDEIVILFPQMKCFCKGQK
jgi:hypothetical protein